MHLYDGRMDTQPAEFRPVGFWVRLLDRLIEEGLDAALRPLGLTRRQWQLLNLLAVAPRSAEAVGRELEAFFSDRCTADQVVSSTREQGLIVLEEGCLTLTEAGAARLSEAAHVVRAARERISVGVNRADYATTVATLEGMCRNLGWEP